MSKVTTPFSSNQSLHISLPHQFVHLFVQISLAREREVSFIKKKEKEKEKENEITREKCPFTVRWGHDFRVSVSCSGSMKLLVFPNDHRMRHLWNGGSMWAKARARSAGDCWSIPRFLYSARRWSRSNFVSPRKCSQSGIIKWTRLVLCSKAQSGRKKMKNWDRCLKRPRSHVVAVSSGVHAATLSVPSTMKPRKRRENKIVFSFAANRTFYEHGIAILAEWRACIF